MIYYIIASVMFVFLSANETGGWESGNNVTNGYQRGFDVIKEGFEKY